MGLKSIIPKGGSTLLIGSISQPVSAYDGSHPPVVGADTEPRRDDPDQERRHQDGKQGAHQEAQPDPGAASDGQRHPCRHSDEPVCQAQQNQPAGDDQTDQPQRRGLRGASSGNDPAFQPEEKRIADPADEAGPGAKWIDPAGAYPPVT